MAAGFLQMLPGLLSSAGAGDGFFGTLKRAAGKIFSDIGSGRVNSGADFGRSLARGAGRLLGVDADDDKKIADADDLRSAVDSDQTRVMSSARGDRPVNVADMSQIALQAPVAPFASRQSHSTMTNERMAPEYVDPRYVAGMKIHQRDIEKEAEKFANEWNRYPKNSQDKRRALKDAEARLRAGKRTLDDDDIDEMDAAEEREKRAARKKAIRKAKKAKKRSG